MVGVLKDLSAMDEDTMDEDTMDEEPMDMMRMVKGKVNYVHIRQVFCMALQDKINP